MVRSRSGAPSVKQVCNQERSVRLTQTNGGIEIFGTKYSARLRALYDRVALAYGRPIKIVEVSGHTDNAIEVRPNEIILHLKPGSAEDNVAHEFMHAVLESEGYPRVFSVGIVPLANSLRPLVVSDFDHLIINGRLLALGYDARRGFLSNAESYSNVLRLPAPADANSETTLIVGLLHELMKFHYYIGAAGAQEAILAKFSQVRPYWRHLSEAIHRLPTNPGAQDMWGLIRAYVRITDQVSLDLRASFKLSELIGFEPVLLARSEIAKPAEQLFNEKSEHLDRERVLLRTFLTNGGVLVSAGVVPAREALSLQKDLALPVQDFAGKRHVSLRVLP